MGNWEIIKDNAKNNGGNARNGMRMGKLASGCEESG